MLSLSGPWTSEAASTQIRCCLNFPSGYPVTGRPRIGLDDVTQLTDESRTKLLFETTVLAEAYLGHQRPSLEAILRYLLGEQTLEESLQWVKRHSMGEGQAFNIDDGLSSSSEDDEDDTTRYVAPGGLEMSNPMLSTDSALYNVPPPRICGALWTGTGRLVCFHPRKQEKEASLVNSSLGLDPGRYRDSRDLFEGFGRLHKAYRSNATTSTHGTLTSADSDDDFELSSSESSSISEMVGPLNHRFLPAMPWNSLFAGSNQEYALEASQKSIRGIGQPSTSAASNADMLVSIHDLSDLLPAKKELAQRYHAQNGLEAVINNALIAKRIGLEERVDTWQLCALLLQMEIKEATWSAPSIDGDPTISPQGYLSVLADNNDIDLAYDEEMKPRKLCSEDANRLVGLNLNRRWLVESL